MLPITIITRMLWLVPMLEKEVDVSQPTAMDDLVGEFVPDEILSFSGHRFPYRGR